MGDLYTAIHSEQKKSFVAWDAQGRNIFLYYILYIIFIQNILSLICRSIAKNIADGLVFLHSLDPPLVHFDLKSKNILVRNSPTSIVVSLIDTYLKIGSNLIAKIADLDSARTQPNMQLSVHSSTKKTLQWTAPELFRGKHVSKKVDVYRYEDPLPAQSIFH